MPIRKEIIYPIFLECCQFVEDTYWEIIFEDLAYGKCSYGTYISRDFLCCSYKGKEFSYKIEKKDPNILYTDIYNLLTKKLGILSKKDKIKKRTEFYKTEQDIKQSRQTWSSIKKKNLKDLLIEQYVIKIKKKYSLNISQSRYLLSIIFIAIVFKVITSKDIDYENGHINNIKGIEFNNKQILIQRNLYNIKIDFSPEIINNKKIMSDNWEKYLDNLKKIK
jgi:hypothetical protein